MRLYCSSCKSTEVSFYLCAFATTRFLSCHVNTSDLSHCVYLVLTLARCAAASSFTYDDKFPLTISDAVLSL